MTAPFKISAVIMALLLGAAAAPLQPDRAAAIKQNLSEYAFFQGAIADLKPATQVFPYDVNAPLFSDYAEKARFIYLPEGATMQYQPAGSLAFPDGAVIIKNFFYWNDAAHPEKGRRIIETRLLLKEPKGWKALEYVWNAAQDEATLEVAGAVLPVAWQMENGKKLDISYTIPNLNQCKGCHSYDGQFTPIGTSAKQLNRNLPSGENQLLAFQQQGKLLLPPGFDPAHEAQLTDYRTSTDVSASARAYLDANCAHCHNPHGPASTSGMFLNEEEKDMEHVGVGKSPVAAGRGSGGRKFGIVPGKPNESILLFRMESDDPGIRMPELGRQLVHEEGVALIRQWVKEL